MRVRNENEEKDEEVEGESHFLTFERGQQRERKNETLKAVV